jgi:hypothetical protein
MICLARVRVALDDRGHEAAWADGARLSIDRAVGLGLKCLSSESALTSKTHT